MTIDNFHIFLLIILGALAIILIHITLYKANKANQHFRAKELYRLHKLTRENQQYIMKLIKEKAEGLETMIYEAKNNDDYGGSQGGMT